MRDETPEQKYERLRSQIQDLTLTSYPNPARVCCPGSSAVTDFARQVADNVEDTASQTIYRHITHCSPCDAEFLKAREELRAARAPVAPRRLSRLMKKHLKRAVDDLDRVMKSVMKVN
jgi:hypothetical protein